MSTTKKTKFIRQQIVKEIIQGNSNPVSHISEIFGISRQAVNRHIKALIENEQLVSLGKTSNKTYQLGPIRSTNTIIDLTDAQGEDLIFKQSFEWIVQDLKKNIQDIAFYGFTEIMNNAIDHSDGKHCFVQMMRTKQFLGIGIADDGEGIFKRIARICNLADERQSIIELSKGKLTTDPDNHSGQGIFFTSRMFDAFKIDSKGLHFEHDHTSDFDFLIKDDNDTSSETGTFVMMSINLDSERTDLQVFEEFSASEDDDFAFNRTIIPVKLAQFEQEQLVSRSQAKRLLARIEKFKYVVFDFSDVEMIGQAFADQIFRVYGNMNMDIVITHVNANNNVLNMINRAKS